MKALGNSDCFQTKESQEQLCDLEGATTASVKSTAVKGLREETDISSQEAGTVVKRERNMA